MALHDHSKQDSPVRAKARVVLAELYHTESRMPCLFNPQQLRLSCQMDVGKLRPVGSSHPTKMYGSTGDWMFPLSLFFSQFAIWHFGFKYPDITTAIAWLSRFMQPQEVGISPGPMLVVVPNVMTKVGILESIDVGMTSFDADLKVRTAEVQLQLSELRQGFLGASEISSGGSDHDDYSLRTGVEKGFRLGSPGPSLNLSRSGGRRR